MDVPTAPWRCRRVAAAYLHTHGVAADLRGERAVPDFAPGTDDAPYRVAFLELAREHLFAHRQQVVRDFEVEWRADAAARRSTRRSARLLLLVPGSGATDDAPTSPSKRQRRGC